MRLFLLLALFLPFEVNAATFEIEQAPFNGVSQVRVFLLASSTPVNAVEGMLVLPKGARVDDLYIGGSVIQNWLEAPREVNGTIRFAGIIPGGFVGSASAGTGLTGPAMLFSFILADSGMPSLEDAFVYANDGLGTRIAVAPREVVFTEGLVDTIDQDRTPPEYIEATPTRDPLIADGQYVLLLESYDNESGVDYFEVQEGGGVWRQVDSIYVVEDRYGFANIAVRSYDRAGNFVEILVPGRLNELLFLAYALLALIILLAATLYLRKRRS